jgi:uncharacterized SAM-binding protein YcdF (DUF218 family)
MFFVLSKSLALLLVPSNLFMLLGLGGLLIMLTRWRRLGRRLALTGLTLILLAGILPVGYSLIYVLENRFPVWDPSRGAPDGIVVLGGALNPGLSLARGQSALNESAERLTILAKLARDYPNARIVFTGGNAALFPKDPPEAAYVLPLLESFGIDKSRVTLEDRSRNTAENATFTKALLQPKAGERWLLVTSAAHMPRSVGCFRQAGFPVEPYPVDWHTTPRYSPGLSFEILGGVLALDGAAHEWEGLLFYWLTGRTSAFFPAP